jgi:hypothetical protein
MSEFLPRDSKGRIQIRIWLILIWFPTMLTVLTVSLLLMPPSASGDDYHRAQRLGIGASLMSFWFAAICAGATWWIRRRQDR